MMRWTIPFLLLALTGISGSSDPRLSVTSIDGSKVEIAGKKPAVLLFLSSECPAVPRYAPRLNNLYKTYGSKGFEFVAMGRALIADPDLINRLQRGEATRSRCTSCNKCVAEMDRNGVRCVLG